MQDPWSPASAVNSDHLSHLPSGTVTFLYTDIEGSTKLWQAHQSSMPQAMARHDTLLRRIVEAHEGVVFRTAGDGIYTSFSTALNAVSAAIAGQRALHDERWPDGIDLQVRMALHTGAADIRDGDYVGHTLNRVARLLSAGHGGQILLSDATEQLLRDWLPSDVDIRDLGEHRLKDLTRPEHIFQAVTSDLPSSFPPLAGSDAHSTNLPRELTPFVGRERDLQGIIEIVREADVRLLTLHGPGGTGKTRLSLRVGSAFLETMHDGVFFVPLAPVPSASLVPGEIAAALGIPEVSGQPHEETLKTYLRNREVLLILDNFEHLMEAAPLVSDLITAATRLKILVTSRTLLRLSAERAYAVPPLQVPDMQDIQDPNTLVRYDAVALFLQRARAVKSDFAITPENARAIAEICYRLDGLPLAIELAAARVRLFPPQALLRRLEHRLPVLTGGARDLPARQSTLRGALDWSYDLLREEEQRLFRRLAVFAGGCDLEAAEIVCNPEGDLDILGGIESLIDKSLIRQESGAVEEPRFTMLQIIREYGLERLDESKEATSLMESHSGYFAELSEQAQTGLQGLEQEQWLLRTERETDNFRAAMTYTLSNGKPELALRIAAALSLLYWYGHGDWREGRDWLERALAMAGDTVDKTIRARALVGLGSMCLLLSELETARRHLEHALELGRETGDSWTTSWSYFGLAWVSAWEGNLAGGREMAELSLAEARKGGSPWVVANALHNVGAFAVLQGDHTLGQQYLEESVRQHRALRDRWALAYELNTLGDSYRLLGDYGQARERYEESLQCFDDLRIRAGRASVLHNLGYVALHDGNTREATSLFDEALSLFHTMGDRRGVAECAIGLGAVAVEESEWERGARLFAAGQQTLTDVGSLLSHTNEGDFDRYLSQLMSHMDAEAFNTASEEGVAMGFDRLVEYAGETRAAV